MSLFSLLPFKQFISNHWIQPWSVSCWESWLKNKWKSLFVWRIPWLSGTQHEVHFNIRYIRPCASRLRYPGSNKVRQQWTSTKREITLQLDPNSLDLAGSVLVGLDFHTEGCRRLWAPKTAAWREGFPAGTRSTGGTKYQGAAPG